MSTPRRRPIAKIVSDELISQDEEETVYDLG